ncbi:hypothetical protein GIB67_008505 [Kingdonia uniflora]|uniref:Uncharacterized protein n=1 Tax=Kingdonia uniflora TaxID=39325 RepID=A0A7J7LFJ3_9MAGN|nr:hypothetical protein GIB67_008505 [Kingdonia uniflora]
MFPRLHINDTEQGGPRAPPRNKMALYEQLSVPSHNNGGILVPPALSNKKIALGTVKIRHMGPQNWEIWKQMTLYQKLPWLTPCQVSTSPGDVVGVIGQKKFWKARKAIANQQRVFAEQVFELHRLIKVQRYLARSPHLLLENIHVLKNAMKVPPKKFPKSPAQLLNRKWFSKANSKP